ncbi:MAG: hypothetical protein ACW98Y_10515 [Candidatus Thorarchaeota archaeon]|jgi:hypothetical protein
MSHRKTLTIDREIEDVKAQVKREIDTIKDLMDSFGYRNSPAGWTTPFKIQRLRRALRIHYLALNIRNSTPSSPSLRELSWDLSPTEDM